MVLGTVGLSGSREQKSRIVINFRERSDRRTGAGSGSILCQRHRRRQPFDSIDIGPRLSAEHKPCIRRKAFGKTPLSFGIHRIKSKRTFSRSRGAGNHHEFPARDFRRDVFQIMCSGSDNMNFFHQATRKSKKRGKQTNLAHRLC